MNVEAYPASANTYDSLSDGYLALGNREEALRYAEKALEMIPKDAEASDDFKKLVREGAEKKIKELRKKSVTCRKRRRSRRSAAARPTPSVRSGACSATTG